MSNNEINFSNASGTLARLAFERGVRLANEGKYREAIVYFERMIAMNKLFRESGVTQDIWLRPYTYIGQCYELLGDLEQAKKWYLKVGNLDELATQSIERLGIPYIRLPFPRDKAPK